jgi:hypothetical protein
VLKLPNAGSDGQTFGLGLWSSLSKENFDLYIEHFSGEDQGRFGPWFGGLSNKVKGHPNTFLLKCLVHPQNDGQRPLLERERSEHPLAVEQRDAITFDQILDFYAASGHDIRPALCD